MTPISPADMVLFAAVVRAGSFTRAARTLGITKQTASERVAKLERALAARLLERTTRHLRLTDAGAVYYARCAAIAAQIEEANHEVQDRQSEVTGILRVSAPVLYGRRFLAPVVTSYLQRHPQARVEVLLSDRRVHLVEEGFDLAVRIGALDDSSLAARRLSEGKVFYVASPAFLHAHASSRARRPARLAPRQLRELRTIGMRPQETWQVAGTALKLDHALVVNDLEMGCEAAIAGIGVARLPSLVCAPALAAGRLQLALAEASVTAPVHAVYPSRQYLPAKTRAFLDLLVEAGTIVG